MMNKVILDQNLNASWKKYRRRDTAAEFKSPRWKVNWAMGYKKIVLDLCTKFKVNEASEMDR
jgi:hypothetical protein